MVIYRKLDKGVEFDAYFSDDDHIVYIKRASYKDVELFYVIVENAYRTPSVDIMMAVEIMDKFGIKL